MTVEANASAWPLRRKIDAGSLDPTESRLAPRRNGWGSADPIGDRMEWTPISLDDPFARADDRERSHMAIGS